MKSIAESKIKSLAEASPDEQAATQAEMVLTIMSRMDYSRLTTPEQVSNFNDLVSVACGLVCEACPEFIVPVKMTITAVHQVGADDLKKFQTVH